MAIPGADCSEPPCGACKYNGEYRVTYLESNTVRAWRSRPRRIGIWVRTEGTQEEGISLRAGVQNEPGLFGFSSPTGHARRLGWPSLPTRTPRRETNPFSEIHLQHTRLQILRETCHSPSVRPPSPWQLGHHGDSLAGLAGLPRHGWGPVALPAGRPAKRTHFWKYTFKIHVCR